MCIRDRVKLVRTTLCVPDAALNVEPVFVKLVPSPVNDVAVMLSNPDKVDAVSPIILPPIWRSLAKPRPPSITTAPLVTAVELVVSLNLASRARISASVISCFVSSDSL